MIIPRNSDKLDWEVELAVVIGKKASYVSEQNAMEHVGGYVLHNDYSERDGLGTSRQHIRAFEKAGKME